MVKKILSIALACALLILALGVLVLALVDGWNMLSNFWDLVYGNTTLENYHNYAHGHGFFHMYSEESWYVNFYSNGICLNNETLCFMAVAIKNLASFINKIAFCGALVSFAILSVSGIFGKINDKTKGVLKLLAPIFLLVFAVGNVVVGLVDSAVWIRGLIQIFDYAEIQGFGGFLDFVASFVTFCVYRVDNYALAIVSAAGALFIGGDLIALFKKKASKKDVVVEIKPEENN